MIRKHRLWFCTTSAAALAILIAASYVTIPSLTLRLRATDWVVLHSYEGLVRVVWVHSAKHPIEVRVMTPDPGIRIGRGDLQQPPQAPTASTPWFYGIDAASGYWAAQINIGGQAAVSDFGLSLKNPLSLQPAPSIAQGTTSSIAAVRYSLLRFPLWIIILLLLTPLCPWAFSRLLARARRGRLKCRTCRYDLTGNVSGVCPECGAPIPPDQRLFVDYQSSTPDLPIVSPTGCRGEGPSEASGQVFRILDANFNRAREALRVMEEYARFVLDDAALTEAIKTERHDLSSVVRDCTGQQDQPPYVQSPNSTPLASACGSDRRAEPALPGPLVAYRDIVGDVGREATTPSEFRRADAGEVLAAATKRMSEALRAIEEYGKTINPEFAAGIERLRYRGYELERRLFATVRARQRFGAVQLYIIITESLCHGDWFETAEASLRGGADCLQLREKELPDRQLLDRAKRLAALCRDRGAIFIVNDRPDIALAAGAHGVHLGQDDLQVSAARRMLPARYIIGVSTHTIEQADAAIADAPDYIAVGPMFDSATKPQNLIAGPALLAATRARTSLPLVAIGGIDPANVRSVLAAGPCGICVCRAVISQVDVTVAIAGLRAVIEEAGAH